jgi:hypothetical protein
MGLPLNRVVRFRSVLQRGNRVQVPKPIRWEFKLEESQILHVEVELANTYSGKERFYGKMNADGRITIPKVNMGLLQESSNEGKSLLGCVLEVQLEPLGLQ